MNTKINLAKSPVAAPVAANAQVATIDPSKDGSSIKSSHRKEGSGLAKSYAAVVPDKYGSRVARKVVDLRIYWPAQTAYACIWLDSDNFRSAGSGSAGGGGYCKESAAADSAIRAAGVKLAVSVDAAGTRAVEDAVLAIATALGYPDAMLVVSHP